MHHSAILIVAIVLIAATALSASSKPDTQRGFIMKTVTVGGKDMKYVVYVPLAYDPAKPMPAIMFLNGAGECGTDGLKQCFHFGDAVMLNSTQWPFIIIFPQKQDVKTLWEDEAPMAMAVLKQARKDYNIDDSRLCLTGISQGGHGTWAIAARHPDLFAAISPVCGWGDEEIAKKVAKLPIWIFHGDADQAVDVARGREMEKWVTAAGGTCKLTIYPGVGHNSWDNAYRDEELGKWFMEHHR
jgi:predicted peptidase